jgi:hypothetical protein
MQKLQCSQALPGNALPARLRLALYRARPAMRQSLTAKCSQAGPGNEVKRPSCDTTGLGVPWPDMLPCPARLTCPIHVSAR